MFMLVMKNGAGSIRRWALKEEPLVIGRGASCDLVIYDAPVSRRHCQLWIENHVVQFKDLGSRNPARVNGASRLSGTLAVGDEFAVGDHLFVIEKGSEEIEPVSTEDTPTAVSPEDTPYFSVVPQKVSTPVRPASFSALLRYIQSFNECHSMACLYGTIENVLVERFRARQFWIVLYRGSESDWNIGAAYGERRVDIPKSLLRDVFLQRRGIYAREPELGRSAGVGAFMVTPMIADGKVFGAVAMNVDNRDLSENDQNFQFFVALIHSFAPIFRSLERADQNSRDLAQASFETEISSVIVGGSPGARELRQHVARAAASDLNVLILGETGSGKEVVSRMIHNLSSRVDRPYVVVNCPAVPRDLFESVMFGHRKGSFTGAVDHRTGYFTEAQGGTLFLDEIGDLPLEFQTRLLRAVETGVLRRVGDDKDIHSDLRIIAATNKPPLGDGPGKSSNIRQDLYHRLAGFQINVPPLRNRREDIAALAEHFLDEFRALGRTHARGFCSAAMDRMVQWDWPGNVRELRLCVERAVVSRSDEWISADDILLWNPRVSDFGKEVLAASATATKITPNSGSSESRNPEELPSSSALEDAERDHIVLILIQSGWNIRGAARSLGIARSTLYKKMEQFGIRPPDTKQ